MDLPWTRHFSDWSEKFFMILGSRQLTLATVAMADGTQLTLATVAISRPGRSDGSHMQLTIANDFSSISYVRCRIFCRHETMNKLDFNWTYFVSSSNILQNDEDEQMNIAINVL